MKKYILIFFALFSFSAIHAQIEWTLSDDGTLTISGTSMPDYEVRNIGDSHYYIKLTCNAPWFPQQDKIKKVVIEDGVTDIGDCAFFCCTNLTSITIPNSVTCIGDDVFECCGSLTSISIPNSVTSLGENAFFFCLGLTSITFEGSTPPEFGKDVFYSVNKSTPVYVPANSIEAYKEALKGYFEETSIQALQR